MSARTNESPKPVWTQFYRWLVAAGTKWSSDNVPRLSAAFAFYAILSIAPTLVCVVAAASIIYGHEIDALHSLVVQTQGALGPEAAKLIADMIHSSFNSHTGTLAIVVSLTITLFSASNLFLQLDDSVKTIWGFKQTGSAVRNIIFSRIAALAGVIVFGAVLTIWIGFDAWLGRSGGLVGGAEAIRVISAISSVLFLAIVFGAAYRYMPGSRIDWRHVWPGALLAAIGVGASKQLLSLYFTSSNVSSVYGSAGALIVILLWLYYTAQIFFFGVEATYVTATQDDSKRTLPY